MSSALEHIVPEQMFTDPNDTVNPPPDAISAVKALSKAQAAGQRIYHITSANQATVLPNINHDSVTMGEIQAALAVGKEVITHTDAVSVPGWSGAGYIIFDPVVGDGAYKISGGVNGGYMYLLAAIVLGILAIAGIFLLGPAGILFWGWMAGLMGGMIAAFFETNPSARFDAGIFHAVRVLGTLIGVIVLGASIGPVLLAIIGAEAWVIYQLSLSN